MSDYSENHSYTSEITKLQQRIAELELLIQTAEQNAAEQRDMKAKAREQRDEQVKKNTELAAQVELLQDFLAQAKKFNPEIIIPDFLMKTGQCLAEHDRDVAARAVEATIDAAIDLGYLENDAIQCKQIRKKIKSGEVEI